MRTPNNERLGASTTDGEGGPERTCVLTRRKGMRDDLIRLALGPGGKVAPDVRARAPGRGAWISVDRKALDRLAANDKLKAPLKRAFKMQALDIPENLGELTETALRQTLLDRLGMEARAGNVVTGTERIDNAARSGKVALIIHAADAGADGCRRLDQSWRVGGGDARGVNFPFDRTILSMALGRDNVVHLALTDPAAAARVLHALSRWRAFCDPDRGLEGGGAATSGARSTVDDVKE